MAPQSQDAPHPEQVAAFFRKQRTGLLTIAFTDLVDSTALIQRLGNQAGAAYLRQRRQLVRSVLGDFPEGEEIETAGDSFLLVFSKPSDAVRFALMLQARSRKFSEESGVSVQERVGLHLGELVIAEDETQTKAKDLYGIELATCFRVTSFAEGGQILLTRGVFDSARQVLKGEDIPGIGQLSWVSHGPYRLKGVEEPVEVCEVAEEGQRTPEAPKTSEKAHRQVRSDEEPVPGWRPAVGQTVPNTPWVLEEKLGEGGFGEVWVAQHPKLKERRVFKFCFRADRVRALKRELTLFRLLKEYVGEHPNIVRLHEVYLDEPPFYLEEEYVEGKDLKTWCEAQGGIERVPLETRLEIVAQAAEALQAAHDAGIIHRDVKPGNILVSGGSAEASAPTMRLTDFGIGQVISEEYLKGVTQAGFTHTMVGSTSSGAGTTMYLAPEIVAGQPATTRSDIYSLGVVLWQLVAGDFKRPLTTDWAKAVADPLLREDLEQCFAGDPEDRFAGAGQLAKSLRARGNRKAELLRLQIEHVERERFQRQAERRQKLLLASGVAALVLVALTMALLYGLRRAHQEARLAQLNAYAADMKAAQVALQRNNLGLGIQLLERHRPEPGAEDMRGLEWRYLWQAAQGDELHTWTQPSMVTGARFSPDGTQIVSSGLDGLLRVWDVVGRKPQPVAVIDRGVRDDDALVSFCFSPDGRTLASAHREGAVGLNQLIMISPDERWLAVDPGPEMDLPNLCVCDTQSGEVVAHFPEWSWPHYFLDFSPDGHFIAVGTTNHSFKVWDLQSQRLAYTLDGHAWHALSLGFSADSRLLATGSWDGDARVWDMATGKQVAGPFRGHGSGVDAVCFSPDARTLLTSGSDFSVRMWHVPTGREMVVLDHAVKAVGIRLISPSGQLLSFRSTALDVLRLEIIPSPEEIKAVGMVQR